MSNECSKDDAPVERIKNESTRRRWELFHRAIAHAKRATSADCQDAESATETDEKPAPILSIVR